MQDVPAMVEALSRLPSDRRTRWVAPNGYDDEVYIGKILRVYTKSHFLDHVMRDTGGHIQEILHYKIICLSHLIDVVSYYTPDVEVLASCEGFAKEGWLQ